MTTTEQHTQRTDIDVASMLSRWFSTFTAGVDFYIPALQTRTLARWVTKPMLYHYTTAVSTPHSCDMPFSLILKVKNEIFSTFNYLCSWGQLSNTFSNAIEVVKWTNPIVDSTSGSYGQWHQRRSIQLTAVIPTHYRAVPHSVTYTVKLSVTIMCGECIIESISSR